MAKVRFIKSQDIWRMDAMYKYERKVFYSKEKTERKAQADCDRQFLNWIEEEEEKLNINWIDAWNDYIEDYGQRWKISSTNKLSERGQTYLVGKFKNKKLKQVRKRDYQSIIDKQFKDKGLAKKTLEGIATTISGFGEFCLKKGYLENDFNHKAFLIPAKAKVKKKRSLFPNELKQILSDEVDQFNWYIPMFRFLIFTGLRRGELCALLTERDLKLPYLTVRESLSNELILDTPKSNKAREEFLTSFSVQALSLHNENRKRKGFESEYVFCSSTGRRISPKVLSENWRKYRKHFNLGDITLHELRHTFASYANKNLSLEELKAQLGHSESFDTVGTYVHELPLTEKEQAKKLALDKAQSKKLEEVFEIIIQDN